MRAALFDLDLTLLECNSGASWIRHEHRAGRISTCQLLRAGFWIARYQLGMNGMEQAYKRAVQSLKGEREEDLRLRTEAWFEREIAHKLRAGAKLELESLRAQGVPLVMATSSSTYLGHIAAQRYGLGEVIATAFEVEEGRFTGEVRSFAYGDYKRDRAREWSEKQGIPLQSCGFYTDSFTDRALLYEVGWPVAVNPDPRLRRLAQKEGWRVVDWGGAE